MCVTDIDEKFALDINEIKIIPYSEKYCDETITMWRDSKEKAICQKDIHSFSDHKYFLNEILVKDNEIFIALMADKVAGIIAFNEMEINQLYIHNEFQNRGIGKMLLDIAKNKSKGILTLYTFEINKSAQKFYEKNGFRIIGRNFENEEKLDDLKYEWKK